VKIDKHRFGLWLTLIALGYIFVFADHLGPPVRYRLIYDLFGPEGNAIFKRVVSGIGIMLVAYFLDENYRMRRKIDRIASQWVLMDENRVSTESDR
jgi:hypothetical protein